MTYSTSGNLVVNDKGVKIFADDSTNANGDARITIPSFSGCGLISVTLHVAGVSQGSKLARVRSTDTDADGRTTSGDASFDACDVDWSGLLGSNDLYLILSHAEHFHRHALHGTQVRRTNLCDTCLPNSEDTYGEGRFTWSPNNRWIAYTMHTVGAGGTCDAYIVASDAKDGNVPQKFTFESGSSDHDVSWSPPGHEIVFHRNDRIIYRKGIPGIAADTSEIGIFATTGNEFPQQTVVSPDGDSVAFEFIRFQAPQGIHTIPMAGGQVRQITNQGASFHALPWWSPGGTSFVFERNAGSDRDIYKASTEEAAVSGGVPFFQPPPPLVAGRPSYSADSVIVLAGLGPDLNNLTTVTLESAWSDPTTIRAIDSNYPGFLTNFLYPVQSPDGTRLALVSQDPDIAGARSGQVFAARRNMSLPPAITQVGGQSVHDTTATVSST